MPFNAKLTTILVFFVPGIIVVTGIVLIFPEIRDSITPSFKEPKTSEILLFAVICSVVGTLIESLRPITVELIVKNVRAKSKEKTLPSGSSGYISKLNADNLPVFTLLVEKTYEYYRLNANVALSFLCISLCYIINHKFDLFFCFLIVVVIVTMIATYTAYCHSQEAISKFSQTANANGNKNQGGE
ncbi:MAG: hypothetical protein OXI24_07190 [Candidatus Poribacteria bacterium]|nr:hypothetical protein [Candidatus Poribacteria bacterium]